VQATKSTSRSFCIKKGIPSITSCATLRSVGDLTFTLTSNRNCIFVRSSSLTCIGLFESALYNRKGKDMGHGQRVVGFPLTSFWEMKLEVEPQSINPGVVM